MTRISAALLLLCMCATLYAKGGEKMITDPARIARELDKAQVYILPQPREICWETGRADIRKAKGILVFGEFSNGRLLEEFRTKLSERAQVTVPLAEKGSPAISLYLLDGPGSSCPADYEALKAGGEGAYEVSADPGGIVGAACTETGLFYAMETIVQMFAFKPEIRALRIKDRPALKYRGMMYDISRGQMLKPETLKRLIRLFAMAKSNMTELYLEDMLKFERYPDIAPEDAFTREEYLELSRYAREYGMEIHPMMQALGHMERIASKGDYKKYMVPMPEGGADGHPWTQTVDVRDPEAVEFVCNLLDEVCSAFPGKYINIDVTEIADYGFVASGTPAEELPGLMTDYINTLNKVANRHGMSLCVAQCQLRSDGHLNGLGKTLDRLDKDIVVGSYYTSEFYGGWDYDYPLLRKSGRSFWVMPWLSSHTRFMPDVTFSMDFTDVTMERGMPCGAEGSITCDWGDYGHIHLPGVLIYPSMYHFSACWNGCSVDRDYFDKAFCLMVFGAGKDTLAKGIVKVGNINQVPVERLDDGNNVFSRTNYMTGNYNLGHHFLEIFGDILDNDFMSKIINPRARAEKTAALAAEGAELMGSAADDIRFNRDFYEEILWSARPYALIAERMLLRDKHLTGALSGGDFAAGLREMAGHYRDLREDYMSLYSRSCRDSAQYRGNTARMQSAIDAALELADKQ